MRHKADDVPLIVAEPSDISDRTVGICVVPCEPFGVGIPKHHLTISLEASDDVRFRVEVAFTVSDWDTKYLPHPAGGRERRVRLLDFDEHVLALKLDALVPKH